MFQENKESYTFHIINSVTFAAKNEGKKLKNMDSVSDILSQFENRLVF